MGSITLEDVILRGDRRGVSRLRSYLPADFCSLAGHRLHAHMERVLVVSGFLVHGKCETDGPLGAMAIVQAVRKLGGKAWLASDGHGAEVLAALDGGGQPVHAEAVTGKESTLTFPVLNPKDTRGLAGIVLGRINPTAVVAVERCGAGRDGIYRNMRGEDISQVTARLDLLFETDAVTIGVGDGGNEVGMGNLAEACIRDGVTQWPCTTTVRYPVIAAVSNWGAWGLVAAMGKDLLPTDEEATSTLDQMLELGCIDGMSRQSTRTVDGWSWDENLSILRDLRKH